MSVVHMHEARVPWSRKCLWTWVFLAYLHAALTSGESTLGHLIGIFVMSAHVVMQCQVHTSIHPCFTHPQALIATSPFGGRLDSGPMLASQRELETRLKVWKCENVGQVNIRF
eukprot:365300-Chlamydomonas_euryale.AAC.16